MKPRGITDARDTVISFSGRIAGDRNTDPAPLEDACEPREADSTSARLSDPQSSQMEEQETQDATWTTRRPNMSWWTQPTSLTGRHIHPAGVSHMIHCNRAEGDIWDRMEQSRKIHNEYQQDRKAPLSMPEKDIYRQIGNLLSSLLNVYL